MSVPPSAFNLAPVLPASSEFMRLREALNTSRQYRSSVGRNNFFCVKMLPGMPGKVLKGCENIELKVALDVEMRSC